MKKIVITALMLVCVLGVAYCQTLRTVKVTVVEEDGTPIKGADVGVYYLAYDTNKDKEVAGKTNEKGVYTATSKAILRMEVSIHKNGYYPTLSGRLSRKKDHEVTYVLRKKKKPIPLYAKKVRETVPGIGRKYGFDFEAGDWVAPHGKGKNEDVYFKVELVKDKKNKDAGKVEIIFPHEKEGIFFVSKKNGYHPLSGLPMPNEAFANGYDAKMERVESGYQNENKPRNSSYFLRIRATKSKERGYNFNYVKFKDGVSFMMSGGVFLEGAARKKHPKEVGMVSFTYYFNPTPNDRNLEFDPEKNLFKNLKREEQVWEP